jgi:hypothetical protein
MPGSFKKGEEHRCTLSRICDEVSDFHQSPTVGLMIQRKWLLHVRSAVERKPRPNCSCPFKPLVRLDLGGPNATAAMVMGSAARRHCDRRPNRAPSGPTTVQPPRNRRAHAVATGFAWCLHGVCMGFAWCLHGVWWRRVRRAQAVTQFESFLLSPVHSTQRQHLTRPVVSSGCATSQERRELHITD